MSLSSTPRSSFSFGAVVFMRPCVITCPAIVPSMRLRCCASRPSFRPRLACLIALALQGITVLQELGADLIDALHAEVTDVHELFLGHGGELAYGIDPLALEAVIGADRELEVLDRALVCDHRASAALAGVGGPCPLIAIGEQPEEVHELPGGILQRLLRLDASVGEDLHAQRVEVGPRAGPRLCYRVVDPLYRREQRVDGDHAYRVGLALVLLSPRVPLTPLDRQAHVEVPAIGDARYIRLGIHDLYVGLQLYVGRRDVAWAVLRDSELYGLLPLQIELQALDVEDDVDDVLFDAFDRRELVRDALYADLGDRGPREP